MVTAYRHGAYASGHAVVDATLPFISPATHIRALPEVVMQRIATALVMLALFLASPRASIAQSPIDSSLASFIARIRAVDNHAHVSSVSPADSDADALPLDQIPPGRAPARLRPASPSWIAGYRALYDYPYEDLSDAHMTELRATMRRVASEQGEHFPTWVLDRIGTEVTVANRVAMGPGLAAPRFRWASYVDALMLPLPTSNEPMTPDSRVLFPLEERLLRRYLRALGVSALPASLDAFMKTVVVPTLARQRKAGAIAVKFEAAYLRPLSFESVAEADARRIYARRVGSGVIPHTEYKRLQDYLFREIAREAGRLGMAVHIHSADGGGSFYDVAGSDPMLLEPVFNDSTLRGTHFVLVHGGSAVYAQRAAAMMNKGNVYADMSVMTLFYSPHMLAGILRPWLTTRPERVLFGTDAFGLTPDLGWEVAAAVATLTGRQALAIALTGMLRDGDISRVRAEEIAVMVMRGNAMALYGLGDP
jgi:predicted TIM-barrel fold metal-dependent hydrolase